MTNPTVHLRDVVVTEGLATPRFFNGRLLSGEALTQLQTSEQAQRQRLGRALGPGVIDGLWVQDAGGATATLRVLAGEALTARGEVLRLAQDVEIALHAAPSGGAGAEAEGAGFHARPQEAPPNTAAVPGVFVLIAGLTQQPRGRAPASGGAGDGRCNVREDVEGVSFRLASVVSPSPLDPTSERLRGQVAALCFGMEGGVDPSVRAYGPPCLLAEEAVRPTEVALAVVQVDGDGVAFVDNWPARRRVAAAAPRDPSGPLWARLLGDEHRALMEAMAFHLQEMVGLVPAGEALSHVCAWLPPAGVLPYAGSDDDGWRTLLGPLAPSRARQVDLETLYGAFRGGLDREAIVLDGSPLPVEVHLSSGVALFVRSAQARLRVSGVAPGGDAPPLRVRRVASPGDGVDGAVLTDTIVRVVQAEVLPSTVLYEVDLAPGPYLLEMSVAEATWRRVVDAVGGRTLDCAVPTGTDGDGWSAAAPAPSAASVRVEVGVGGGATLPGAEGVWYRVGAWHFDPAAWGAEVALALRAEGAVSVEGTTGRVRLVRASTGAVAAGPLSFGATEVTSAGAPFEAPASPTVYVLQALYDASAGDASFALLNARVVVTR